MRTTMGTAKIVKKKLKNGDVTFTMSVIRSIRSPMSGLPRPMLLKFIGSVRESEIRYNAEAFWKKTDKILKELYSANELWFNDIEKISRKFEMIIPRPSVPIVTPKSSLDAIRAELADRGIKI